MITHYIYFALSIIGIACAVTLLFWVVAAVLEARRYRKAIERSQGRTNCNTPR